MNKRVCIIFILGLLLLPLILNFVASQISQIESENIFGITPDSGVKLTQKWDYLGKEWKTILMQNSIVKGIDSFFQKINAVFLVLFGIDYSMSLVLFLTVFLWLYLFFILLNILGNTLFSKGVALIISFGIAIGAAQIKLFQMPVNLIIGVFFGEKPWWMKLIVGIAILAVLAVIFVLQKKFGKQFAANKKKMKEEKNRIKLQTGARAGEALSRVVGKS